MKPFALIFSLTLVFAFPTFAADKPLSMDRLQEQAGALSGKTVGAAKFKFCCKNENNRACHASNCSNCTAFCSGEMVVDPSPTEGLMGR